MRKEPEREGAEVIGYCLDRSFDGPDSAINAAKVKTGSLTGVFFEYTIEVGQVVEARFVTGVENVSSLTQALACVLNTAFIEIVTKGLAGLGFE